MFRMKVWSYFWANVMALFWGSLVLKNPIHYCYVIYSNQDDYKVIFEPFSVFSRNKVGLIAINFWALGLQYKIIISECVFISMLVVMDISTIQYFSNLCHRWIELIINPLGLSCYRLKQGPLFFEFLNYRIEHELLVSSHYCCVFFKK